MRDRKRHQPLKPTLALRRCYAMRWCAVSVRLSGDGKAWHAPLRSAWLRERDIVAGQWAGPWRYARWD